jgi:hypothetical protein
MSALIVFLGDFLLETSTIVYESGLFILFGFLLAGVLHVYLRPEHLTPFLGQRNLRAVLNAALLGAPLPLCSCGVLPTTVALRRKGASRESAISFMISTPETSVESIALSYGLLGPVFAVIRPIAAVATAIVAGLLHIAFGDEGESDLEAGAGCRSASCDGGSQSRGSQEGPVAAGVRKPHRERLREALNEGYVHLFDELAFWLLFGILLTGLLGAVLPDEFFARTIGTGLLSMIVVVLLGVPLYMCASGSTPVALALLAKGLSPGAALVFLLTGPATNAATLSVTAKVFGKRFLQIYLGSIVGVAILFGLALNEVYEWSPAPGGGATEGAVQSLTSIVKGLGALVFLYLAYGSLRRTGLRRGLRELGENLVAAVAPLRRFRFRLLYATGSGRALLAAGVALYFATGLYTVEPGEVGIERTLGAVSATDSPPGLHWRWPFPIGDATTCSVEGLVRIDIGFRTGEPAADPLAFYGRPAPREDEGVDRVLEEAIYLTGDENLVDVLATAHYRVTDGVGYALGLEQGEGVVRNGVLSALVRELTFQPIDLVLTNQRSSLEENVRATANRILASSSPAIRVEEFQLLSVHSPTEVHYDFRDVASAQEDRARMIHEAKVYEEEVVHKASGRAAELVAGAEGKRAERVAEAKGMARQFELIEEAARAAPESTRLRLYLETVERTFPTSRIVVRPDQSAVEDFEVWFQTGETRALPELLSPSQEEEESLP